LKNLIVWIKENMIRNKEIVYKNVIGVIDKIIF